jgi:hypothetical protein
MTAQAPGIRSRFQTAIEQFVLTVAFVAVNGKVFRVDQYHESDCRFLAIRGGARSLSARRTLRPSANTCLMKSSPVKAPRVRRQSLVRPAPLQLARKAVNWRSSAATRSSSVGFDITGLPHKSNALGPLFPLGT